MPWTSASFLEAPSGVFHLFTARVPCPQVDILYHPLFQIHILGRKPVGPLARPFKAASPLPFAAPSGDKLSGDLGSPTAGLGGLGGLGGRLSGFAPALAAAGDATSETPKVEEKPDADEATGSATDDAE